MNKAELIAAMSEEAGLTKNHLHRVLQRRRLPDV